MLFVFKVLCNFILSKSWKQDDLCCRCKTPAQLLSSSSLQGQNTPKSRSDLTCFIAVHGSGAFWYYKEDIPSIGWFHRSRIWEMLLFWRKRRQNLQDVGKGNANVRVESTHDARKTLILFIVLHVYIVICAVAFQQVEQVKSEGSMHNLNKMAENMSRRFNISLNSSMRLIQQVIYAEKLDGKVEMSKSWSEFSKAFWFVTILFTTVGRYICFIPKTAIEYTSILNKASFQCARDRSSDPMTHI